MQPDEKSIHLEKSEAMSGIDSALPTGTSVDFVMGGKISLVHPIEGAYRTAIDGLLLAACFRDIAGQGYDLGAGCGAIGYSIASTNHDVTVRLVENDPFMASCARAGLKLDDNSAFAERLSVLEADVSLRGEAREAAGLLSNSADWLVMNPPYFAVDKFRKPKGDLRSAAFMLNEEGLEPWFRTAAALLKPSGRFGMVFPAEGLADILSKMQGRFGEIKVFPLFSKKGEPAKRVLVCGIKGNKAPLSLLQGLVLHESDGSRRAQLTQIIDGDEPILLYS